jgi:hypothetical protein
MLRKTRVPMLAIVLSLAAVGCAATTATTTGAHAGGRGFCATHACIPSFFDGDGSIVECADGEWSHSGGESGACSYHGGER